MKAGVAHRRVSYYGESYAQVIREARVQPLCHVPPPKSPRNTDILAQLWASMPKRQGFGLTGRPSG